MLLFPLYPRRRAHSVVAASIILGASLLAGCATIDRALDALDEWHQQQPADPTQTNAPAPPLGSPPAWDEATLSSNWDGKNAERRMMNILSPAFSDSKVADYLAWQHGRKANTVHLILSNRADGEGGGYSLYGNGISWKVDAAWVALANRRIEQARRAGFAVVLWGATDDDDGWNRKLLANPEQYMRDLDANGLLAHCSTFVLGLEMTEWGVSDSQVARYAAAVRAVYPGKIGVHHNSDRADFVNRSDILFWQVSPGKSAEQIRAATRKALSYGKPVNFFELARNPNPALCDAAMDEGAFAVGNW